MSQSQAWTADSLHLVRQPSVQALPWEVRDAMNRMGVRVSSPEISQTGVGIRNSRLINANKAFWKHKNRNKSRD